MAFYNAVVHKLLRILRKFLLPIRLVMPFLAVCAILGAIAASIVATVGWYNGKTVSGIVSQVNAKDSTDNNNKSHSLNIKYEINGVQHEHRVNPVRQQPMHEVGDNIKLLLFNGNASLKTVWEQFGLSIFLGITGALCLTLWRGLKALGV